MKSSTKAVLVFLFAIGFCALLFALSKDHVVAVMQPKGSIALAERNLILTAFILMLTIVIPVYVLTLFISWRYRAGNKKAAYTPTWDRNRIEEFIWWAVPCVIIFALAILTWKSSHELDPFRPLQSNNPPLTIEVVALNWKWLFIYPEQNIATVNFLEFPANTPIDFKITADAPMNSFWIPQLAGQIYAMPGMITHLNLTGAEGEYQGLSANLSGEGFSGMHFIAKAVPRSEFDVWAGITYFSPDLLDEETYKAIKKDSVNDPVSHYRLSQYPVFDSAVHSYMSHMSDTQEMNL